MIDVVRSPPLEDAHKGCRCLVVVAHFNLHRIIEGAQELPVSLFVPPPFMHWGLLLKAP